MIINAKTSLYVLLGNPVTQSLGPIMHNCAFRHHGHNAVYLACRVKKIGSAVKGIRSLSINGASVTIPHKETVMEFLDHIDPLAVKIGAVNTILHRNGELLGFNTDGIGAVRALKEKTKLYGQEEIGIVGAGGAARAIGFALREANAHIRIYNRSVERGEKLAKRLDVSFSPLVDFKQHVPRIIINTTPVGMVPHTDRMVIPSEWLEKGMIVMDAVYNPVETKLLIEARKRGCRIVRGRAMFVYQGAAQYEIWTGDEAPLDIMKNAVYTALEQSRHA